MNLQPKVEAWGAGDQSWLASRHGADVAKTVTLKGSAFKAFGEVIPSGVPLKKGAGDLYEPVAEASELEGFLFTAQTATDGNIVAPMVWHGRIKSANLPKGAADVTAATNPQFKID